LLKRNLIVRDREYVVRKQPLEFRPWKGQRDQLQVGGRSFTQVGLSLVDESPSRSRLLKGRITDE
jgi:hypothetical protein